MVHAGRCELCGRDGRMERIRKNRLGFGSERIDRNGTLESFAEDRSLVHVDKNARPKVDDKEPYRDRDPAEYKQIFVYHMYYFNFTSKTGGTVYLPSRMAAPGMYARSHNLNVPVGAGSQLDSWPVGAVFWM